MIKIFTSLLYGIRFRMTVPQIISRTFSELNSLYAFWVLLLVDCLGHGSIANRTRGLLLSLAGFNFGKGCIIRPGLYIHSIRSLVKVGTGTSLNKNTYFDASSQVSIGSFCNIGHGVKFAANSSDDLLLTLKLDAVAPLPPPRIVIEDFVWLSCNVLVLGGVSIGKGSVVGAGSVVTSDIPSHSFAIGNPAKVIRQLSPPHTHSIIE